MSPRVRPPAPLTKRKGENDQCPRGHQLRGYNGRNHAGRLVCRACTTAYAWARRHQKFYDDPEVLKRADALAADYVKREA